MLAAVSLLVDESNDGGVGGDHDDEGQQEGEREDEQEVQVFLSGGSQQDVDNSFKCLVIAGYSI